MRFMPRAFADAADRMKRRDFIALVARCGGMDGARPVRRLCRSSAILARNPRKRYSSRLSAFREGLADAGYAEGRNVAIEFRWAEGQYHRLPALAKELAGRQPAVIVAPGGAEVALAAKSATTTIPIVFEMGGDPVALGVVDSLSRPGGNLTGVSSLSVEVSRKRLEFMREVRPDTKRVRRRRQSGKPDLGLATEEPAGRGGQPRTAACCPESQRRTEFDGMFAAVHEKRAGGLVFSSDPYFAYRSQQLAALAVRHAVPAITQSRDFPLAGGLMSYGGDFSQSHRHSRDLCRPYPQGREAFRSAGAARHQGRAVHQSEGRRRPRRILSAVASEQRRPGDRMIWPRAVARSRRPIQSASAHVAVQEILSRPVCRGRCAASDRRRERSLVRLSRPARQAERPSGRGSPIGGGEDRGFHRRNPRAAWLDRAVAMVGGYRRQPQARRLAPAAPGPGRREPQPGRCRRQGAPVRVAHRPEPDRGRRRPVRESRRDRSSLGPGLVWPGHIPGRLGTVHDHRRRGQPLGGRSSRRRGQSQVHLGGDLGDPGGADRRGVRARRAGTPRRSSGHQPGAAGRRSRAATAPGLAGRHSRQARPGDHRSGHCGQDGAGGDGADPRRQLERHRQATARRGLRADLRRSLAHGARCSLPAQRLRRCSPIGWPSA